MGWVPQDAALFPHLTVGENIGLGSFIDRAPYPLSGGRAGGQAQRVALALARAPDPALLLLDGPFAALDPLLRAALRTEVAQLVRARQCTTLLVTHDQEEAHSLADHVAVMRNGRIPQRGTPTDVYERPASRWVASFVGDTVEFGGGWAGDRVRCALGTIEAEPSTGTQPVQGAPARLVLRPEWLRLDERGTDATTMAIVYAKHDALVSFVLDSGIGVRARIAARTCLGGRPRDARAATKHHASSAPRARGTGCRGAACPRPLVAGMAGCSGRPSLRAEPAVAGRR